ncbi:MAG: phosphodiester glycosidase family protein [Oscillospiraceae bacterium]|nr:phosphodiester glycosidase family protein [Oscillospiraceae bacterium]
MKKVLSVILCALLVLSSGKLPAAALEVQGHQVALSTQTLSVNGVIYDCEKYNIDGSNYFKLRDLAWLLNGTASQFDVGFDGASNTVTVTTSGSYSSPNGQELAVGTDNSASAQPSEQTLLIDGAFRGDLEVYNIGGSNFFKLRDLGAALGFVVDYDEQSHTMLVYSTDYAVPDGDAGAGAGQDGGQPAGPAAAGEAVVHSQMALEGRGTVDIVTVDLTNPRVHVKSVMVGNTLGATASFTDIVAAAGNPAVVVNGNFFEAYKPFQTPIGHVMVDGQMLYAESGLYSLGIDSSGRAFIGDLPIFVNVKLANGGSWAAYSVNNVAGQGNDVSALYTPAWGPSLTYQMDAYAMTVRDGAVASYGYVANGETVEIPGDGFVLFIGAGFAGTGWFLNPLDYIGSAVTLEPYLFNPTDDAFDISQMVSILSGSPRLVKDGAICTEMRDGFSDPQRFGPAAANPRTAVGVDAQGRLIIASFPAATIQELRETMLSLGCVDAFNLDGGASRAMYCNGVYYAQPGRFLTTTLQVFVDG